MQTYRLDALERMISKYVNKLGGEMVTIQEGCLGLGTVLLHGADGYENILIQEVFLNEWSSTHKIRRYKKIPKKYDKYVE